MNLLTTLLVNKSLIPSYYNNKLEDLLMLLLDY